MVATKLRRRLQEWYHRPSRSLACNVAVDVANAIGTILDQRSEVAEAEGDAWGARIYRDSADRARLVGTEAAETVRTGSPLG